MKLKKKNDVRH